MKKILLSAVAVLLIAVSFASCYDPYAGVKDKSKIATSEAATASETETKAKEKTVSDTDYKDNYEGLRDYMKAYGFIKTDNKDNITEMKAELIGAEKGYKYTDGDTRVELYSFNLSKENATRDKVISSVKEKGTFTLYSTEVTAYLSDNGKYLMVYSNAAADDKNSDAYKTKEKAIKAFKAFKADSVEKADVQETTAKTNKK